MSFHTSFIISSLLLITFTLVIQSIPIEKIKEIVQKPSIDTKQAIKQQLLKSVVSESISSTTTTTTTSSATIVTQNALKKSDNKKKRNIELDDISSSESNENDDVNVNNKINHVLHTQMQETSAKIHDNADKPVNTDDSKIFSDSQMTPNQLTDIVRGRRDIKLNRESNRRRKRALSPYDIYDTDALYDPYVDVLEGQQYDRPVRSFAPIYWYPNVYERTIRAALVPPFYEPSAVPNLYSGNLDLDENDEVPTLIINDDDDDDENDYEFNRYPILSEPSNTLFDNLQLQQQYNTDDLPIDEDLEQNIDDDDDDEEQYRSFYQTERPYDTRYGSIDTYF